MRLITTLLVVSGTFLGMAALYGIQPLLPLLSRSLAISETASASLITWSLLAMAVGPLVSGWAMQRMAPRRLLRLCLLLLGLSELAFASGFGFGVLKLIRLFEGLLISGVLAATMTYIILVSGTIRQTMGYYVAASVAGGLSGRIVAGFLSQAYPWPSYFLLLGGVTLVFGALTSLLPAEPAANPGAVRQGSWRGYLKTLQDARLLRLYGIVFLGFFAMTGLLNYMPFRLEALDATMGQGRIALYYLGFLLGLVVSVNAPRIAETLGGLWPTVVTSLVVMAGGAMLAAVPSVLAVFAAVTILTSGFFLIHAVISASLTEGTTIDAATVNSLYITIYYMGGAAGSYLPGLVYAGAGWSAFLVLISGLLLASFALTLTMRRRLAPSAYPPPP